MNETFEREGVVAVVEFGATARGDADHWSDRDIFVLLEDMEPARISGLRDRVARAHGTSSASVACYTVSTVDRMIGLGSLFLWHLRLEGRPLFDPDGVVAEALGQLSPYDSQKRDVDRFGAVYRDVERAFKRLGRLSAFESHVLFGIARNTCMVLTAVAGVPAFGRSTVLPQAVGLHPDLPLSADVYSNLEAGHLRYHRDAEIEWTSIQGAAALMAMEQVRRLLTFADVKWVEGTHLDLWGAVAVLSSGRRPSYRVRLQIERCVFERLSTCLAAECGLNLQHLNADLRTTVRRLCRTAGGSASVTDCVDAGVDAVAALRELASFDPYVVAGDSDAQYARRPVGAVVQLAGAIKRLAECAPV